MILYFVIGSVIGSFLNVLIDRISQGRPFVNERSICDSCKKQLQWFELLPLFSFLLQRGKCRHCKARIPTRLFFVELVTGILFAGIYFFLGTQVTITQLILYLIIACALLVIFEADVEYRIIPDQMLIILLVVAVLQIFLTHQSQIFSYLLTAVISFSVFLLLFIGTKGRGIGFGDVKFSFVIGMLLGFPQTLVAIYSAFIIGAVISLGLVVMKKKKMRGDTIAFGPFMVVGIVVATLFSDKILQLFF